MSFFKKLFGKEEVKTEETLVAPITGKIVPLEEVPDPVFAQKMMGDGIAIEPTEGTVVSPVKGEIIQFFPTKHAIGIKSETGVEVLIHVGLETVSMKGEGFEGLVEVGDKVEVGTPLLTFDIALIKEKAKSIVTPVILTNGDVMESVTKHAGESAVKGETTLIDWKVKA
ncbi:Glucose-specific phosphotransferase enzyme IIA component [Bacillus sp. THAF10]|uniref:PTS sugar transporter subunit IIA n=1 Tax=Bacillus sp. THAF10 TaxID=2587848 RepID=UPI001268F648|nr:PTS glucose transporter subunit IIA [Bacillus sp. THAF10]QFT91019.1 Glucose-specific phosphotransferase enzyme IIA component [Bacillus sp. THAF10]